MRLGAQNQGQRFQVKSAVDEKLSLGKFCRQFEFAPDTLPATREDSSGTRLTTGPPRCQLKNSLQVRTREPIPAVFFGLAQRMPNHILGQDRILAVRLIGGPGGLKIEANRGIRVIALKLGQFADVFTCNHFTPCRLPQELLPQELVGARLLERPVFEALGEWRRTPQVFAGRDDRGTDGVRSAIGYGSDFPHRKSFNRVQDKNLAIAGRGGLQSKFDQRIYLVGRSDVFGRGHAAVGDDAFLREGFIRLMKLELRFVAGANVRNASRAFQVDRDYVIGAANQQVA